LIWPKVVEGFDDFSKTSEATALAHALRELHTENRLSIRLTGVLAKCEAIASAPLDFEGFMEHGGYCNAYQLNAGYAVENLLKAVRIRRLVSEGKPISFRRSEAPAADSLPTNHEYVAFARAELGDLSFHETDVLERLGTFVRWAGRYPVDRKPESLTERVATNSTDHANIHALCTRLIDKYESFR